MVFLRGGMFFPPLSIHFVRPASVTFLPSAKGRAYMPLSPGPIFCAVVSAKWQEAQCSWKSPLPETTPGAPELVRSEFALASFHVNQPKPLAPKTTPNTNPSNHIRPTHT